MAINVNNKSQSQQVHEQRVKDAAGTAVKPGLTGKAAAMNAAAMVAMTDVPTASVATTSQSSLLGSVGSQETAGNASAFGGANQGFSLSALFGGKAAAKQVSVLDNPLAGLTRHQDKQAAKTEVGKALAKVAEKLQERVAQKTLSIVSAAQTAVENNPQVKEAAAKAAAAGMVAKSGQQKGKETVANAATTEQAGNLNGADGKVYTDFVTVAGAAAATAGLDISKMSIEDAMVYMCMVCSNDARDDMKDMLKDMEATRKKRAALRDAERLIKEQQTAAKSKLTEAYNALPADDKKNISLDDFIADKSADMTPIVMDYNTGTALLATDPGAADLMAQGAETVGAASAGSAPVKFSDLQGMADDIAGKKDSLADISQEQQLKMQMVMEAMTKMEQLASNISKKLNDTVMAIISNFK